MENKKIILPTKLYDKAPATDLNINLNLDESTILLREGDMDISLDVAELFNKERNESNKYKVYGKTKMIFRNMYTGNTSYEPLRRNLYLVGDGSTPDYSGYIPYNEFAFLRNDVLREVNVPVTGTTLGTFTQNIQITGYTGHTTITSITAPYQNWNVYMSYVDGQDNLFPMNYTLSGDTNFSFNAGDGIPFRVTDDGTYYIFTCPVEHGINQGEYLIISGGTLDNIIPLSGRTFYVDSLGNSVYNSDKHVLNILKNQFTSGTTLGTVIIGRRCIDKNDISGTTSNYYVHKMKTLTDNGGYIMDKIGFESPIWRDEKKLLLMNSEEIEDFLVERNRMESVIFDFKEPFILSGLTNNMGYTPTDVYVSVIFRNGNGYFDYPPKVGYKFNFHDSWIDEQFSGTTAIETGITYTIFTNSGYTFQSGNEIPIGTTLTGAFVEYNERDFKERIISESYHKLTIPSNNFDYNQYNPSYYSGATTGNTFGFFYQPFYRIKLRELSPYVETSNTNDVYNLPENTKYSEDEGLWKWRDLYDHGYIDPDGYGTNYPFINGVHYVHTDINFYFRNEVSYLNKNNVVINFNNININC